MGFSPCGPSAVAGPIDSFTHPRITPPPATTIRTPRPNAQRLRHCSAPSEIEGSSAFPSRPSTTVENPLHIAPLPAQNKPNSQNPGTTATSYATKPYTNIPLRPTQKNKPNSNRGKAEIPMHIGTQFPQTPSPLGWGSPAGQSQSRPLFRLCFASVPLPPQLLPSLPLCGRRLFPFCSVVLLFAF